MTIKANRLLSEMFGVHSEAPTSAGQAQRELNGAATVFGKSSGMRPGNPAHKDAQDSLNGAKSVAKREGMEDEQGTGGETFKFPVTEEMVSAIEAACELGIKQNHPLKHDMQTVLDQIESLTQTYWEPHS